MLKEKREFEIGDKVVILGVQNSMSFIYKVGIVIVIDDYMVGVEFDFENYHMHSCDGAGKAGYCYKIKRLTNDKIRRVNIFEYDEKELDIALEKFNNRKYSLINISNAQRNICSECDGNCNSCILSMLCDTFGLIEKDVYYADDLTYNSFVNIAKEELEHEYKK